MTAFDEGVGGFSERTHLPEVDEPHPLILQNYELGRSLVQGRASTVREAKCKETGGAFAIKAIPSETNPSHDTEVVLAHEALILKKVNHPNCVKVHKVIYCAKYTYLILTRLNGNTVLERIQATKGISEVDTVQSIVCVCKALQYLHAQGIVHRAVEPRNIIYSSSSASSSDNYNNVVLCGFHNAYFTAVGNPAPLNVADRRYVAPEMIAGNSGGAEGDVYALGKLLFHMLAGELPGKEDEPVGDHGGATIVFDETTWGHLSPSSKELVSALLSRDPAQRLSLSKVGEHRWVKTDASSSVNRLPPSHRALILLREISTLQDLGIKCLQDISEHLELVSVPAGQLLYRAGDVADFVFFVCGGSVLLQANSDAPETVSERGYFGQRPAIDGAPYPTDAKSLGSKKGQARGGASIGVEGQGQQDATSVFRLAKADLDQLMATYPPMRTALLSPSPSTNLALPSNTRPTSGSGRRLLASLSKRNLGVGGSWLGAERTGSAASGGPGEPLPRPSHTCSLS